MAEKAKEPATAAKVGGGRGRLLVILLVGLVVMLGAGGAGAYFMGLFGGSAPASASEAADAGHEPASAHAKAAGDEDGHGADPDATQAAGPKVIFVDLPDVLVNLSSDSRRMRFLKLRLAVEVSSQGVADTVVQLTPRIMDSFQLYLRGLTVDDLAGPSALHRLKQEMLARINLALEPSRIEDVLFKEMLVQ